MPTFDTPTPIIAAINVVGGEVRINARDVETTTVSVEPSDPSNEQDRKAAEQTRVEFAAGGLLVRAPKLRSWVPRSAGGMVDVTIELPAGSSIQGGGPLADVTCDGRLGDCRIKTALGRIQVDEADTLSLKAAMGDISVEHASGHAEIVVQSGEVRVRELGSTAVIKNSNGDTWIGHAAGDLRVSGANGDIAIDMAEATVVAKSAKGDVRLGEAVRSSVVLETKLGDLEVGIREGTAAWLDVRATAGEVRNELEATDAPGRSSERVEVHARTSVGDIVVRRPARALRR